MTQKNLFTGPLSVCSDNLLNINLFVLLDNLRIPSISSLYTLESSPNSKSSLDASEKLDVRSQVHSQSTYVPSSISKTTSFSSSIIPSFTLGFGRASIASNGPNYTLHRSVSISTSPSELTRILQSSFKLQIVSYVYTEYHSYKPKATKNGIRHAVSICVFKPGIH